MTDVYIFISQSENANLVLFPVSPISNASSSPGGQTINDLLEYSSRRFWCVMSILLRLAIAPQNMCMPMNAKNVTRLAVAIICGVYEGVVYVLFE